MKKKYKAEVNKIYCLFAVEISPQKTKRRICKNYHPLNNHPLKTTSKKAKQQQTLNEFIAIFSSLFKFV